MRHEDDFQIRPGHIRSKSAQRVRPFIHQALAAAQKAGATVRRGRISAGRSSFGRGRQATHIANRLLTSRSRLAVIKARVVRHKFQAAPLQAHLRYLQREGVTRDGEKAGLFGPDRDGSDGKEFAERCTDDRHHFRFIVSPEDAVQMEDLQRFTRDLMKQAEVDLETLASLYLVYCEDGKHVLGCSRLTPINLGCMLQDHFSYLVDDPSIFRAANTWEGTRFCIDSRLPADERVHILRRISVGYLECALHFGWERIIGLMPTLILRSVFERNGIALTRLGKPQAIGDHSKIQAACIDVTLDQYHRACQSTGTYSPLGLIGAKETMRHVA